MYPFYIGFLSHYFFVYPIMCVGYCFLIFSSHCICWHVMMGVWYKFLYILTLWFSIIVNDCLGYQNITFALFISFSWSRYTEADHFASLIVEFHNIFDYNIVDCWFTSQWLFSDLHEFRILAWYPHDEVFGFYIETNIRWRSFSLSVLLRRFNPLRFVPF